MPIETTLMLYTFEELSDKAKERARQWWREARDSSDLECVTEDFHRIAEILGIDFKTHEVRLMSGKTRQDPNIWWSIGYCQSDYAAFEGTIRYRKGMTKEMAAYAPQDAELQAIAAELAALFAKGFYRDVFVVSHTDYRGSQVEPAGDVWSDAAYDRAEEVKPLVRRLNDWLYKTLRTEDEWQSADEQVDEALTANEYTFEENGTRRD